MYEYKKSKDAIESILKSPTKIVEKNIIPSSDAEFTHENGIKAWVGALFMISLIIKTKETSIVY